MIAHGHQCNDRRAGDAPVLGWGHGRCALAHVISNSRASLARIPANLLPQGVILPRQGRFTRPGAAILLPAASGHLLQFVRVGANQRRCPPQHTDRQVTDAAPRHSFQALSFAVADECNQPREALNAVPEIRASGTRHDR